MPRSESVFRSSPEGPKPPTMVVVGPGSTLTIPGIIVAQITAALTKFHPVTQVNVDLGTNFKAGGQRAPSLALARDEDLAVAPIRHRAPANPRLRERAFRQWIPSDVGVAIGFVWPTIDDGWIHQFLAVAHDARVPAVVVCASVPRTRPGRLATLASAVTDADLVLVGDDADADALSAAVPVLSSKIETHPALALRGKGDVGAERVITAFLPRDDRETLSLLMDAFVAIPEAWVDRCVLQVVMRFADPEIPEIVAGSAHARAVRIISHDLTSQNLERLCNRSSALIVADPAFDSRAYAVAVGCGVPIVVLAPLSSTDIGRGYVGALLADLRRPVSINVGLTHALRLAELRFPEPDAWNSLAKRLLAELTVEP